MKLRTAALPLASALALAFGAQAQAAVIPVGVHNDVALATVTGTWGWTEIWRGGMFGKANFSDMFAKAGTHVMVAGFKGGSSTVLEVLAATTLQDALAYTALNQTKLSNGARWYSNGFSFGFAGANDTIQQSSADVGGQNERDRLSWHTSVFPANGNNWHQDHSRAAQSIFDGYRHGAQYHDSAGQRVIFTLNLAVGAVPEPSTWALLILGFGAVGGTMRRRTAAASRTRAALTFA